MFLIGQSPEFKSLAEQLGLKSDCEMFGITIQINPDDIACAVVRIPLQDKAIKAVRGLIDLAKRNGVLQINEGQQMPNPRATEPQSDLPHVR